MTQQQNAAHYVLLNIHPLTLEQRSEARETARTLITKSFGPRPRRSQFTDHATSEYPRWLTFGVGGMLLIVFFAAANVSVFRVFTAGRDHFAETINVGWQASLVGISTFLLAEFMVIASTIAQRIYFKGRSRWLMAVPIVMGLAMAFVGNWAISQPELSFSAAGIWSVLETATPPAAVLFMSIIGERIILEALRSRHANEKAYQDALARWQALVDDPEASSKWYRIYASTLRDALKDANLVGRGQKARGEIMANLTGAEWSMLITRELKANEWFDAANGEALLTQATLPQTAPADPKAAAPARAAPGISQPQTSAPSPQPVAVTPALAANPEQLRLEFVPEPVSHNGHSHPNGAGNGTSGV
jgi:hypothetical protein